MSTQGNIPEPDNAEIPVDTSACPRCGSMNWSCWDERVEWFRDRETGEDYEFPVGYLHCKDCGRTYTHTDADGENVNDEYYGHD